MQAPPIKRYPDAGLSCLRLKIDNSIGPEPMDQRRNADAETRKKSGDENCGFDS
jgi:hypothetical protein